MRRDPFLLYQPAEHRRYAIGHLTNQPLRFQLEPFLDALDHGPGRLDFSCPPGRRRFDINNDASLHIDQIVGRVGVKRWAIHCRPTRGGIRRRDRRGNGGRRTLLIKGSQILAYGPCRVPWIAQVLCLLARRAAAAIGIGLDHTGVDGKAFTAYQSFLHAPLDDILEQMPKRLALTEATVTILRERRMVRHRILKTQPTEPAIRQSEMDLLAQPALATDAKAVTHDRHPHHQLRMISSAAKAA